MIGRTKNFYFEHMNFFSLLKNFNFKNFSENRKRSVLTYIRFVLFFMAFESSACIFCSKWTKCKKAKAEKKIFEKKGFLTFCHIWIMKENIDKKLWKN